MSETTPSEQPYDPAQDPDADPDMLNPRDADDGTA